MTSTWMDTRRDIFIRDLFRDFFNAKTDFDAINAGYRKKATINFTAVENWIGSESTRGPLWLLKDLSHRLFRTDSTLNSLYEHLFDWTLGSIFHEAMKLKEDAYQIESYKPLLEIQVKNNRHTTELSRIIQEYYTLIEKARTNLAGELADINELFIKALFHLREMIPGYAHNLLLVQYLLDNRPVFNRFFGRQCVDAQLRDMFPRGKHDALLMVARSCIDNGWHDDARRYLNQVLSRRSSDHEARELLERIGESAQHL